MPLQSKGGEVWTEVHEKWGSKLKGRKALQATKLLWGKKRERSTEVVNYKKTGRCRFASSKLKGKKNIRRCNPRSIIKKKGGGKISGHLAPPKQGKKGHDVLLRDEEFEVNEIRGGRGGGGISEAKPEIREEGGLGS